MTLWRREQLRHLKCSLVGYHKNDPSRQQGRCEARKLVGGLNIEMPAGFIIHHINDNPTDNAVNNILLMSREDHTSLHQYLQHHRSLLLKDNSSNFENCWNTLRDQLTTAWLEMTNATVIKIVDIGQSAAEPLKE